METINFEKELKKATQEFCYAEKMAKKWVEKRDRREKKMLEVDRLASENLLEKSKVRYAVLKEVLKNLPPILEIKEEIDTEEENMAEMEENPENTTELHKAEPTEDSEENTEGSTEESVTLQNEESKEDVHPYENGTVHQRNPEN